jgi:predicted secreted hydrolase
MTARGRGRRARGLVVVVALAFASASCTGGPILANAPIVFPSAAAPSAGTTRPADPIPISLPRDDGPHDRLTEWWYYTGHLQAADGRRFGFEAVVFRAERGSTPAGWAAHLALTDESGNRFYYAQRAEFGPQVDRSPRDATGTPTGFDLAVSGLSPVLVAAGAPPLATPWHLAGANGTDRIEAALSPDEATAAGASFGLALDLRSAKQPVRHNGDGFVDFGAAGTSYYYSRTRLAAIGQLDLNGERLTVTGIAWFDHQWGDFVSVGAGGWDWFAINLNDGTDITLSVVRDERANELFRYGTLVRPSGDVAQLGAKDFAITTDPVLPGWQSAVSGRTYPGAWQIQFTGFVLRLVPTVVAQELDTRATTGVTYWEGSNSVIGGPSHDGGDAYVEITRYDAPGG